MISDFEEESYKERKGDVFLAFVDAPVKENEEVAIEDTFIGGQPVWLHPGSKPCDDMLTCGACKSKDDMRLLLQAFAPLDSEQVSETQGKLGLPENLKFINGDDDRVLYVFICTKCQRKVNSVKCIRGVKKHGPQKSKMNQITGDDSMGKDFKINPFDISSNGNNNPFGANTFATNNANPFSTSTKAPEATTVAEEKPAKDQLTKKTLRKLHDEQTDKVYDSENSFKSYILYVDEEHFKNTPEHLKLPKNVKIDKEALDLTGSNEEDLEKDPIKLDPRTEKLSKFLDDDAFQKFQEVVGYNPLQVLRYDLGGKPLYYSEPKVDFQKIIANPSYNPSSRRAFEMQLMPKMIMDLEDISFQDGMEWGTILVFTDIENYIPDYDENEVGYVEETVKVQWEVRD